MKKRIIAFLVCVLMFVGAMPVQKAFAATDTTKIINVISMTGYMETDKAISSKVTRAQFAQILYNLTSSDPTVTKIVNASLYSDVSQNHWAASYIKEAVSKGYMMGYLNGKFKPGSSITLQEAVYACLKVLGYQDTDFSGGLSATVMSLYQQEELDTNITLSKTSALTKRSCIYLIYNLLTATNTSGVVYGTTKGYGIDQDGEIDYLSLVDSYTEGPVIVDTDFSSKFTSSTYTTVYMNDEKSAYNNIQNYDVIYYNDVLKTIWAYDTKVTGTVKAISPSKSAPTEVTIASNTYTLGTKSVISKFSNLGTVEVGDMITVLLGKDNDVVGVLSADSYSVIQYGYVEDIYVQYVTNEDSITAELYVDVVDFSGTEHSFEYDGDITDFSEGNIVTIDYKASGVKLELATYYQDTSKKISDDGTTINDKPISSEVQILEMTESGFKSVSIERLKGCILTTSDIYFDAYNDDGELVALMLNDYTNDSYTYAIVTDLSISNNSTAIKYLLEGESYTTNSSSVYSSAAPVKLVFSGNSLSSSETLGSISVEEISSSVLYDESGNSYKVSDNVQVYFYKNNTYTYTSLAAVSNLNKYRLNMYYDKNTANGGLVRIIIAYQIS